MTFNLHKYQYRTSKPKPWIKFIIPGGAVGILLIVALLFFNANNISNFFSKEKIIDRNVSELWNAGLYEDVIAESQKRLDKNPLDPEALIYYGFAQFHRAFYEQALEDKIGFLDRSILALRKAKLNNAYFSIGQINYILGKAYYHKGRYFYDLTVYYIEKAIEEGYIDRNTYEYLGLAYGALDLDTVKELEYFKKASVYNETDQILLSISKSYQKMNEEQLSEEYLLKALQKTEDSDIEKECHMHLAKISQKRGDLTKAEKEYKAVLDIDPRSVEAHYQLGLIYYSLNDIVKGRAEIRNTLRLNPNHEEARRLYYNYK
jgi:tetratricopeptide (TPR) repeat protein